MKHESRIERVRFRRKKLCVLWIYLWLCVCARMIDDREREREQHSIDAGHHIAIARIWTPTFTVSPSRFMRWLFQRLNCAIGLGCYLFVMLLFVFLILFPFTLTFYLLWIFFRAGIFLERSINTALNIGFCIRPVCHTHDLTEIHNNNTKKLNKKKHTQWKKAGKKSTSHKQNL